MRASAPRSSRSARWSRWRMSARQCAGGGSPGWAQAARRGTESRPRASVSLSVSANAPAEPRESPERLAAAERDGALVARARAGDTAAFDMLVRTYMEQAFRVAYRVVGHRE